MSVAALEAVIDNHLTGESLAFETWPCSFVNNSGITFQKQRSTEATLFVSVMSVCLSECISVVWQGFRLPVINSRRRVTSAVLLFLSTSQPNLLSAKPTPIMQNLSFGTDTQLLIQYNLRKSSMTSLSNLKQGPSSPSPWGGGLFPLLVPGLLFYLQLFSSVRTFFLLACLTLKEKKKKGTCCIAGVESSEFAELAEGVFSFLGVERPGPKGKQKS